ncbi:MAG: hypothetical protein ACLQFM_06295 [Terriglobales bacterium]
MNNELSDEDHEALGAMLHRGITEARAYAATPEGQAQLCKELLEIADSEPLISCGTAAILRLAAERFDVLQSIKTRLERRVDELIASGNQKHERIVQLKNELNDFRVGIYTIIREMERKE